jgi:membrane protein DedA with SNARE-associated domain
VDAHALAHQALDWLSARPAWLSIGVCGGVAAIEYVIPPIPHDIVVIAGGVLAARGVLNPALLIVVVTIGSALGALAAWRVGILAVDRPGARRFVGRFLTPERFEKTERMYRRWGRLLLVANRFLPGVRTTLLFGAGMFRMPPGDVFVCSAVSAFLWNGLLVLGGTLLGQNLDQVLTLVERYSAVGYGLLGLVVVWYVVHVLRKRHGRRRASAAT